MLRSLVSCCALTALSAVAQPYEATPSPDGGTPVTRETQVRSRRAPHSASEAVVERDVLEATPKSGATDLLRAVPGLVATQHSGEGKAHQLFLRGFDAVHGQDVELNVAGLPVNQVSHIHALGYADLNWLIPEAVKEVRVTQGSGRAWQGDFAVAGTVRYELGLEEPGVHGAVGFGSFNRARAYAGVRPVAGNDSFAAVELLRGDGFGPQRAFRRVSALGQFIHNTGPVTLRAVAGAYGMQFESPGVMRADSSRDFYAANGAGQGGETGRYQALLGVDLAGHNARSRFEVFSVFNSMWLRNNFTGDGLEQSQQSLTFGTQATHQRALRLGTQTLLLDGGLSLRGDVLRQSQRPYREADGAPGAAQVDADITQLLGSGWLELAWAPGGWRFMLGGRLDVLHVTAKNLLLDLERRAAGPHFGVKAGIERQLGEWLRLFAAYGDGFRTPQARQLSDKETAPFVNVHGGEAGLRFDVQAFETSLAGFVSYVGNDFFFDHTIGTTRFVGETLRGGGQLQTTVRPAPGFVLAGNVTVAHAQLLTQQALLPYFAPLVARLDAGYARPFSVGSHTITPRFGLGASIIGPRPLPYGEWSNTWVLVDARAGLRIDAVELTFDVQNLLGTQWRDGEYVFASNWNTQSQLPARHFTAGAPRTFFLNLELHL